jgi:hypothetical protein
MKTRDIAGFLLVVSLSASGATLLHGSDESEFVVHEWGTFTSIAGEDGRAVDWLPLRGGDDLPCFVKHLGVDFKGTIAAKVRMETPVLYFYAPRPVEADVSVQFNQGLMTEWFPPADVTPSTASATLAAGFKRPGFSSSARWQGVSVRPQTTASFPDDHRGGHYYVARRTEAAPLAVGAAREKFLFYRGVGAFEPPVSATVGADDRIAVRNRSGAPVGDVVLFENRDGRIAYRIVTSPSSQLTFESLQFDGESAAPQGDLERLLIRQGLYPAEAKAMVDTWRDSWFEEGARLFYIVPRRAIDDILPVEIRPSPSTLVRVFVGRIELVTGATRRDVAAGLASNDERRLAKYGRFLPAILTSLPDPATADERARRRLAVERAATPAPIPACR